MYFLLLYKTLQLFWNSIFQMQRQLKDILKGNLEIIIITVLVGDDLHLSAVVYEEEATKKSTFCK